MKKYHFITGLPRSGSTLLTSILNQNPRFHSGITDSLANMIRASIEASYDSPGMNYAVPVDRRINTIKSMIEGFYSDVDKDVIFNTNRAWTYLTPQIKEMYPESKLIVCVRDINWILDSFETIHRKNPFSRNTVTGGVTGDVYSRSELLMDVKGIVGFPYIGIKQAITGNEKNMLILVEYDMLCKQPENVMKSIYNFIDEPYYNHDFENVGASWDEYDAEIGIKFHEVKNKVEFKQRQFVLPPDILNKFRDMEVWRL